MRNLNETLNDITPIQDHLNEGLGDAVKKVGSFVKNKLINVKNYVIAVSKKTGEWLQAVTPQTIQNAVRLGKPKGIFFFTDKASGGWSSKKKDVLSSYGSTVKDWERMAKSIKVTEAKIELGSSNDVLDYDTAELREEIKAVCTGDAGNLMIWGAPGIGKTAIVRQVMEATMQEGSRLIIHQLGTSRPEDLFMPTMPKDEFTKVDSVPMKWMPMYKRSGNKEIDREADAACGTGLLFLDELSRTNTAMQNAALSLMEDGEYSGWQVGSGWHIIGAGNRDTDDEESVEFMTNAMKTRIGHINFVPSVEDWTVWIGESFGKSGKFIANWVSDQVNSGNMEAFYDVETDGSRMKNTTPRSWRAAIEEVSRRCATADEEGVDLMKANLKFVRKLLCKNIATATADLLCNTIEIAKMVPLEDIKSVWTKGNKIKLSKDNLNKSDVMRMIVGLMIDSKDKMPNGTEFNKFCEFLVMVQNESIASNGLHMIIEKFRKDGANDAFGQTSRSSKEWMQGIVTLEAGYPMLVPDYKI